MADAAVDVAPSLVVTASHEDPATEIPAAIDAGVPTFKAFMVYDFGLDDAAILRALEASRATRRDAARSTARTGRSSRR